MKSLWKHTLAAILVALLAACGAAQDASPSAPATADESASESIAPTATVEPSASPEGPSAFAGAWTDVTAATIGETADYTNMVELADVNGDGLVDIVFANGGEYEVAGDAVASRAFLAQADGSWLDATDSVFGDLLLLTRVIKVGDLDADGDQDIFLATTYNTQSHLLLGDGSGAFTDATATNLPAAELSIGDVELGDVDADGDLDLVMVDWGDEGPAFGDGGLVNLWLNDGAAGFTDATADNMPTTLSRFSWDLELVDVDNDWDLDVAVSRKLGEGGLLFENDGAGTFSDVTEGRMPAFTNNYEYAPIDLDGDEFLDLVTINDGTPGPDGFPEHVLRNDGEGAFVDATDDWWPKESNPGWDDNGVYALDVESDGDADFIIGSLDGPDRLLVNDGSGSLSMATDVFEAEPSRGSLGFALADLNADGRLDVVEAQGEVPGHHDERIYFATEVLSPDSAAPHVRSEVDGASVLARVHDNRTPNKPLDWRSVVARWDGGEAPMTWYGENLFRAVLPDGAAGVTVCAVDAAGNEACSP